MDGRPGASSIRRCLDLFFFLLSLFLCDIYYVISVGRVDSEVAIRYNLDLNVDRRVERVKEG